MRPGRRSSKRNGRSDTTHTRRQIAADAAELERRLSGELLDGWEDLIPTFTAENGNVASRAASGIVINAIAPKVPELVGGSADLASSTNTIVKGAPSFGPTITPDGISISEFASTEWARS